jgi:hypothetical protein
MKLGIAVVALGMSVAACVGADVQPASTELTSAQVRRDRADLAEHLDEAEKLLATLEKTTDDPHAQRALMRQLVVIFSIHVAEQAAWEDMSARDLARVRRELDELVTIGDGEDPDLRAFVVRGWRLVAYERMYLERRSH